MSQRLRYSFFGVLLAALLLSGVLHPVAAFAQPETLTAEELALVKQAEAGRVQTVAGVYGAVVAIYGNDRQGGGSGVVYDPSGLAMTNHHVVAAAGSEGWAGLADGRLYRWRLIGTDPGGDIAIIQLTGKDQFPTAPLANSDAVRVGDWVLAMGNPFVLAEDQTPTVTLGVVSGIQRYQAGAGKNTLVYGNCIQVDTSINPGNSGGPSFDLHGRVIGINGRISAMERGRVNVGVGYAISMNQVCNFLPDLLAVKVAQHGTLDAQFATRGGQVICNAINVDSPAARAGLKLGDRLVAFEGQPIDDVNAFTNLLSTLPADWPVEVVHEREGRQQTLWVRLTPLLYEMRQPPAKEPGKEGAPKKDAPEEGAPPEPSDEDKTPQPSTEKPDGDKTPEQPKVLRVPPRGLQLTKQGEVLDEKLNREMCRLIFRGWQAFAGTKSLADKPQVFRLRDDVLQQGDVRGNQELLLSTDGRFRVMHHIGRRSVAVLFDGQKFYDLDDDGTRKEKPAADALSAQVVLQAATLAAAFANEPFAEQEVLLMGGDKSQQDRAYRIRVKNGETEFGVWLSVLNDQMQPEVRLLKAGLDIESLSSKPAMTFADWRAVEGVKFPFRRALVTGLAEKPGLEFVTRACELLDP